jgi:hypothetical protein
MQPPAGRGGGGGLVDVPAVREAEGYNDSTDGKDGEGNHVGSGSVDSPDGEST